MANGDTQNPTTNGTNVADEQSELDVIREEYANGKLKLQSGDELRKTVNAWKKTRQAVEAAEKNLEGAKAGEDGAVLALARACGGKSFRMDNVLHDFASRSGRVFLRRKLNADVIELDIK